MLGLVGMRFGPQCINVLSGGLVAASKVGLEPKIAK